MFFFKVARETADSKKKKEFRRHGSIVNRQMAVKWQGASWDIF